MCHPWVAREEMSYNTALFWLKYIDLKEIHVPYDLYEY